MLTKFVSVGDKLEITLKNDNNKCYLSQVDEIKNDKEARIYAPIYEGKIVPLAIDSKYEILFFTELGCYHCKAIVKNRVKKNNFYFIDIEIVTEIEKIQRRRYVRFKCLLKMKYIKLQHENNTVETVEERTQNEKNDTKIIDDSIVKDISGGGIRFVSSSILEIGERIQCFIGLNNETVIIVCEIILKESTNNEFYKFDYRARFINISDLDRDKIIKYIFDEQRSMKLKEKTRSTT